LPCNSPTLSIASARCEPQPRAAGSADPWPQSGCRNSGVSPCSTASGERRQPACGDDAGDRDMALETVAGSKVPTCGGRKGRRSSYNWAMQLILAPFDCNKRDQ
jgi:hypothetical protein